MSKFDKERKYQYFPRTANAETFYLTGEKGYMRNWTGDCRIKKIDHFEKYDVIRCQFGYKQRKKAIVVLKRGLRILTNTLEKNDHIHCYGTTDFWRSRRIYVVFGIIKFPTPNVETTREYALEMELAKLTQGELNDYFVIANDLEKHNSEDYKREIGKETEEDDE